MSRGERLIEGLLDFFEHIDNTLVNKLYGSYNPWEAYRNFDIVFEDRFNYKVSDTEEEQFIKEIGRHVDNLTDTLIELSEE